MQPSHCSRDLVRFLAKSFEELPPLTTITVPVKNREEKEMDLALEVQFPHDLVAGFAENPWEFQQLLGTEREIQQFWMQKDLRDPAFAGHPALLKENFSSRCIPIRIHSDGVVMSKSESLHVVSWSSFFGRGSVLEVQLMFSALVKSVVIDKPGGGGTMQEIYQCLQWSLSACLAGLHPTQDWKGDPWPLGSSRAKVAGTPLHPKGFFLAVFSVVGDLDELCNQYGLKHFNAKEPCFLCEANDHDTPWTDFAPSAKWRATVLRRQTVNPPPSAHKLWTIPGVTVWTVGWDILHGLDLGPTQHALGNILEDLVLLRPLGRNMEERIKAVWDKVFGDLLGAQD